jgi:hypothetical protein
LKRSFLCIELGDSVGNAFAGHELFFLKMFWQAPPISATSTIAKPLSQIAGLFALPTMKPNCHA